MVKQCLLARKHVQSEKPIAGDIESAAGFIRWYLDAKASGTLNGELIWAVAEEFRLMPSLDYMRDDIQRLGPVQTFHAQRYNLFKEGTRFIRRAGGRYQDTRVASSWTELCIELLP